MGFHSVFQVLQDLFPSVDARVLKAVAIEHPKDVDVAAEVVLNEILPSINDYSDNQGSPSGVKGYGYFSGFDRPGPSSGTDHQGSSSGIQDQDFFSRYIPDPFIGGYCYKNATLGIKIPSSCPGIKILEVSCDSKSLDSLLAARGSPSSHSVSCDGMHTAGSEDHAASGNVNSNGDEDLFTARKAAEHGGEVSLDQVACIASHKTVDINSANNDQEESCGSIESEEQAPVEKCQENSSNAVREQPGMSATVVNVADSTCGGADNHKLVDSIERTVCDTQLFDLEKENHHMASSSNTSPCLESSVDQIDSANVEGRKQTAADITVGSGSDAINNNSEMPCSSDLPALTSLEECPCGDMVEDPNWKSVIAVSVHCRNDSSGLNSVDDFPGGEVDNADDPNMISVLTQSGQSCRIDVLEEIIENAKNYKKTLFSAMESVIGLMREVEYHERAADEAKEEAAKGGLAILDKVEELKRMLPHAKEANDMHAGEVFGEKAILATEAKELQSRLLSLSDEKENSIAVLDEMRQTLDARLSAAEEVKKAAEMEKLDREMSAKKALAEQEAVMEMVVQESKIIQQQAEENSKLRGFLVDRGHLVDALQGEISVICKDVMLLKEKLDQRLPLSESVSSSQTTCKLASSSSSLKNKASDIVLYQSDMIMKQSIGSSVDDRSVGSVQGEVPVSVVEFQTPRTIMSEERVKFDHEILVDNGWEICDRE